MGASYNDAGLITPVIDLDIELVVAFLLLYQDIEISVLARYLKVDIPSLQNFLEYLQQKRILEYEQSINNITLLYHTLNFEFTQESLEYEDLLLLGFFAGRELTSFKDIHRITGLNSEQLTFKMVGFILKGFIEDISYYGDDFTVELTDKFVFFDPKNLDPRKKALIGYIKLRVKTNFDQISLDLNTPIYPMISSLLKLLLSGILDISFEPTTEILGEQGITIYYNGNIDPDFARDQSLLSENERMVLGYSLLEQKPNVSDIGRYFSISRVEIIEILSTITYEGNYQFFLVDRNQIVKRDEYEFTNKITLKELDSTSIFDYHALLGILSVNPRWRFSKIAEKLNERPQEIYKRIIELYLQNLLNGSIRGSVIEVKPNILPAKSERLITLQEHERILLGALFSKGKLSWLEIRALLNVEREVAIQRGYSILGKMASFVRLHKEKEIRMDHTPIIPPLVDSHNLSPRRKVVLGMCRSQSHLRIRPIKRITGTTKKEAMSIMFYLIGSGLVVAKLRRNTFRIIKVNISPPLLGIRELDSELLQTYNDIIRKTGFYILKVLAWRHHLHSKDYVRNLFILVADGYLEFRNYFGILQISKRKDVKEILIECRNCGALLSSLDKPCPNCLIRPVPCVICRVGLVRKNAIAQCPNCLVEGHLSHFNQWLDLKGTCPSCRTSLNTSDITISVPSFKPLEGDLNNSVLDENV